MTHSTKKRLDRRWWRQPEDGRDGLPRLATGRGSRRILGRLARDGEIYVNSRTGLVKIARTGKKEGVRVWAWSTWLRRR